MSDPDLPPPETCIHNLHRAADRSGAPPEATDLCRNALGVVHMLDCPLFLGKRCAWYEQAPQPHPETSDVDLAAAREELLVDFLGWRYRIRVRNLAKPRDLLPTPITVEAIPSPLEAADVPISYKPDVAAALAVPDAPPVPVLAEQVSEPPPGEAPPPAVESYPGQRRSEDRGKRKRRRERAPVPLPVVPVPDDEPEDGDFGEGVPAEAPEPEPAVPEPPRTVEQLLDALPEAALPDPSRRDRPREGRGDRGRPPQRGRRPMRPGDGRGGPPRAHGGRRDAGPRGDGAHGPATPDGPGGGDRPRDGAGGPRRRRRRGRGPRAPGGPGGAGGPPSGGAPPRAPSPPPQGS